jgi:hypothetical protein
VSLLTDYALYGVEEPKTKEAEDEVIYHFVKGHGWIPETPLNKSMATARQAAKAANFGWTLNFNTLEQHATEIYRARLQEEAARWWGQYNQIPVTVQTHDDLYFVDDPYLRNRDERRLDRAERERLELVRERERLARDQNVRYWYLDYDNRPRQIPRTPEPRATNPDELTGQRYFQGAGVAPERVRQENQHERRVREYREAQERARRGRR